MSPRWMVSRSRKVTPSLVSPTIKKIHQPFRLIESHDTESVLRTTPIVLTLSARFVAGIPVARTSKVTANVSFGSYDSGDFLAVDILRGAVFNAPVGVIVDIHYDVDVFPAPDLIASGYMVEGTRTPNAQSTFEVNSGFEFDIPAYASSVILQRTVGAAALWDIQFLGGSSNIVSIQTTPEGVSVPIPGPASRINVVPNGAPVAINLLFSIRA